MTLPVHIRPAKPSESGFISDAWLRSFRDFSGCEKEMYHEIYRPIIDGCIKHCTTMVIAHNSDPDQLYGFVNFICDEFGAVVNYLYVKATFRKMGFANFLLARTGCKPWSVATFTTPVARKCFEATEFVYAPTLCVYAAYGDHKHPVFRSCVNLASRLRTREKNSSNAQGLSGVDDVRG